jgi:hypothetical protein
MDDKAAFFRDYVVSAYKSLENPDFSFVKKGFASRPYDPVIKRLRDYAAVEELTEADDEVCFSYLLKGRAALWKLDLSLVGPFGVFARLKNRVAREDFLFAGKQDLVDFEGKVVDILKGAGIRLLNAEDLEVKMPVALFVAGKDEARLYQALFSDRPKLPWG